MDEDVDVDIDVDVDVDVDVDADMDSDADVVGGWVVGGGWVGCGWWVVDGGRHFSTYRMPSAHVRDFMHGCFVIHAVGRHLEGNPRERCARANRGPVPISKVL